MPAPTEIVIVKLPFRNGEIAGGAPMLVYPEDAGADDSRIRHYDSAPALLAMFEPGESEARFDASWDGETWTLFGRAHYC